MIPLRTVLRLDPETLGLFPHFIAFVNAVALTALALGWWFIRHRAIRRHRIAMLTAITFILAFLVLYVTRISVGGITPFPGPRPVYLYLYLPTLSIHVILSIVCLPMVLYNTLTGLTLPVNEVPHTRHPRIGPWAVKLWILSLSLGELVYLLLRYM